MKFTITGDADDIEHISRILDTLDPVIGQGRWTCDIPATEGPA